MIELFDTHCHLFMSPLADDVAGVLASSRARGVVGVVVPAYDRTSWPQVERLAALHGAHPALGLHPWVAHETLDTNELAQRLEQCRAVAVGEIGLDHKIDPPPPTRQLEVLRLQLSLAGDLDLPVLLHCRGAFEELITELAALSPRLRGVVHAYSRGPQLAQRLVDLGLHVAFGGAVTRPRADRARRSARVVPGDRLLLETDAPSIGLDGVPPEAVRPGHVRDVAEALAALRETTVEAIAEETTRNARALFDIR